jgi:hypothetical protein
MNDLDFLASLDFWVKEAEEHEREARYALDQFSCDIRDIKQLIEYRRKDLIEQDKPQSARDWS